MQWHEWIEIIIIRSRDITLGKLRQHLNGMKFCFSRTPDQNDSCVFQRTFSKTTNSKTFLGCFRFFALLWSEILSNNNNGHKFFYLSSSFCVKIFLPATKFFSSRVTLPSITSRRHNYTTSASTNCSELKNNFNVARLRSSKLNVKKSSPATAQTCGWWQAGEKSGDEFLL